MKRMTQHLLTLGWDRGWESVTEHDRYDERERETAKENGRVSEKIGKVCFGKERNGMLERRAM